MMVDSKTRSEPAEKETANLLAEQIEQMKQLFPECFTEGKVDWEKLRATLGDQVDERPERYSFTWAGKRDAIRLLQTPSRATLVPAKDESVNFDATENLFIEGDNLEVLKLLYKSYFGRVKMIDIDPPYNTGNDFVYPDNYADPLKTYLELTQQITSNPETSGRYHSAWLSMIYPRLFLARQLLREDGVIFVSIDDHEVHNLRLLMNEVFGEENFVDCVVWQKKVSPSNDAKWFSSDHDYLVVYAKSKEVWRPRRLLRTQQQNEYYKNPDNDPRGRWNSATYTCNKSKSQRPNLYYSILNPNTGEEIWPKETAVWKYSKEFYQRHVKEDLLYWGVDGKSKMPRFKQFLTDAGNVVPRSIWQYSDVGHTQEATQEFLGFFPSGGFDSPKPTRLLKRVIALSLEPDENDIVLDFFAGSCTTAQAVLELNREDGGNRRFIMVQLPEPTGNEDYATIADIGKERIRRVIAKMKKESASKLDLKDRETPEDLGFKVFKLAQSNYKQWNVEATPSTSLRSAQDALPTPAAYATQVGMFADPLVDGWKLENVIYEVAIKEGYGLNCRVESVARVKKNTVHRVADPDKEQSFYICLDDKVRLDALKPLELKRDDLFICRDRALDDDAAANLALQCRLKTI